MIWAFLLIIYSYNFVFIGNKRAKVVIRDLLGKDEKFKDASKTNLGVEWKTSTN